MQTSRRDRLDLEVDLGQRPVEVGLRARLVHPGVDHHDPGARGDRPGVAVRHAGPGQRQAQAPEPGQRALAAADLALAGVVGHRRRTLRRRARRIGRCAPTSPHRRRRPRPPTPADVAAAYFAALAARDVEAMVACWAPGGREYIRGQVDTTAPDGVRDVLLRALRRAARRRASRSLATTVQRERAVVRWELDGTFAGGAVRRASSRPGARPARGHRRAHRPRRAHPGEQRLHRRHDLRPPDRAAPAGGLGGRPARSSGRSTPRAAWPRGCTPAAPSRSPTASGASAAASRRSR